MDSFEAAGIIELAFPKHPLFWKPHPFLQVEALDDALMYARMKCGSNTLGDCIAWAREYIKDYDKTLKRNKKKGATAPCQGHKCP